MINLFLTVKINRCLIFKNLPFYLYRVLDNTADPHGNLKHRSFKPLNYYIYFW